MYNVFITPNDILNTIDLITVSTLHVSKYICRSCLHNTVQDFLRAVIRHACMCGADSSVETVSKPILV